MADSVLILVQIIFIVLIACMAFGAGILPNLIPWCKKSTNLLGIANAFSGGVFLAIAFMHILPEVSRDYNTLMTKDKNEMYGDGDDEEKEYFPLPFALAFAGYAFILLIDKVIFDTHSLVGGDHHGHTVDPAQAEFIGNVKSSFIQFQKMLSTDMDNNQCINDSEIINMGIKNYLSRNDKFAVRMSHALRPLSKKDLSRTFVKKTRGLDDEQAELFADKNNIDMRETNQDALITHDDHDHHKKKRCSCNLTPVVLMIALSTHAVFEGIAVGLVKDLDSLWTYVIAISLHKWAAAMSLGISMSKNFKDETKTMYLLLLIFAFATPLGISIGMGVSGSSGLTDIIFSSLAGGTFVYIACSEVIVEEFSTPEYKWIKMIVFLLGAALITSLNFLES